MFLCNSQILIKNRVMPQLWKKNVFTLLAIFLTFLNDT